MKIVFWYILISGFSVITVFSVKNITNRSESPTNVKIDFENSKCKVILNGFLSICEFFPCLSRKTDGFYINFTLYNRFIVSGINISEDENMSLNETNFDNKQPVKIITHGYGSDGRKLFHLIKNAILKEHDMNVITVSWEAGAKVFYTAARKNTDEVAKRTAKLIKQLVERNSFAGNSFHLIGHSLGAHISGMTARFLKEINITIPYITALDPASPLWSTKAECISKNDAEYVEVIHTDVKCFGLKEPIGHTDFYPNTGRSQPGCEPILYMDKIGCSHSKSYKYFADSINNNEYEAYHCASYKDMRNKNCNKNKRLKMGGLKPKTVFGIFYLETKKNAPYHKYLNH